MVMSYPSFPFICGVQKYVEYIRVRAEESRFSGSKYSAYLVTMEQSHQLVGRAKHPTFKCRRYRRVKGFKLLQSDQPADRLRSIEYHHDPTKVPPSGYPQLLEALPWHWYAVRHVVRRVSFETTRRVCAAIFHVLLEDIFEARAGHREAMSIDKQF